jgi:hypothetical protein
MARRCFLSSQQSHSPYQGGFVLLCRQYLKLIDQHFNSCLPKGYRRVENRRIRQQAHLHNAVSYAKSGFVDIHARPVDLNLFFLSPS